MPLLAVMYSRGVIKGGADGRQTGQVNDAANTRKINLSNFFGGSQVNRQILNFIVGLFARPGRATEGHDANIMGQQFGHHMPPDKTIRTCY